MYQVTKTPNSKSVMLFCPVRTSFNVLSVVLNSHARLKGNIEYVYLDDCDSADSLYLRNRLKGYENVTFLSLDELELKNSDYDNKNHTWTQTATDRIAEIRNAAISHFKYSTACEYLFMVDSDLVLHPDLINHLVRLKADVVSEVFWTKWKTDEPYLPNVWDVHPYVFQTPDSILRLREPGCYPVGGLGACTLFDRQVIEDGDFHTIPGVALWGEDRHLSIRLSSRGNRLLADTVLTPFHIYREDMVEEAEAWLSTLSADPEYFRSVWLTEEWADSIRGLLTKPAASKGTDNIIAFCLPGEKFSSLWVNHWTAMYQHCQQRGLIPFPQFGYSSNVYTTRNTMWRALQETGIPFKAIVWIDDDNLVNPEDLDRLLTLIEQPGVGMAAGWCWVQPDGYRIEALPSFGGLSEKNTCVVADLGDVQNQEVREAGYTGFPLVAMRGELLQKLGCLPFLPLISTDYVDGMSGEDVAFCYRLKEAGYKILVDTFVKVVHLKTQPAEPLNLGASMDLVPVSVRE